MPTSYSKVMWTDEEVQTLYEMYLEWPVDYDRLPRHSRKGIHQKASRLGLTHRRIVPPSYGAVERDDWIYMAGLFDGEGTAWVRRGWRQGVNRKLVHPVVSICNTHQATMDWVATTWPGCSRSTQFAGVNNRNRDLYEVKWIRRGLVIELLNGMMPYLRIKAYPAQEVLDYMNYEAQANAMPKVFGET